MSVSVVIKLVCINTTTLGIVNFLKTPAGQSTIILELLIFITEIVWEINRSQLLIIKVRNLSTRIYWVYSVSKIYRKYLLFLLNDWMFSPLFHWFLTLSYLRIISFLGLLCQSTQTAWLKMTGIYCLTVLETRVQNQGVDRAIHPLEVLGKELSMPPSYLLVAS